MNTKVIKICSAIIIILLNIFIWNKVTFQPSESVELQLEVQSEQEHVIQVFYSENGEFAEGFSQSVLYKASEIQEFIGIKAGI